MSWLWGGKWDCSVSGMNKFQEGKSNNSIGKWSEKSSVESKVPNNNNYSVPAVY